MTLEQLALENSQLKERIRVLEFQATTFQSQIIEMQKEPRPSQIDRWFEYGDDRFNIGFDFLEVSGWDGSKRRDGKDGIWNYSIIFRGSSRPTNITQPAFDAFYPAFTEYRRSNP